MHFASVNFLSILVATVAAWLSGAVYYTALSKPWMAAQGKTPEQCKAEQASKTGAAKYGPFIVVFVSEFVMAWVLYGMLFHLNMFSARAGAIAAAFCWLGFVVTTIASNNAFANRRTSLTVIDSIAWLIALLLIGVVLGAWGA